METKVILIEGEACASCIGLEHELRHVLNTKSGFDFEVVREMDRAQELIDKYQVEKLPVVMVLDNNQLLGQVSGFQPAFILDVWLDSMKEKGGH